MTDKKLLIFERLLEIIIIIAVILSIIGVTT